MLILENVYSGYGAAPVLKGVSLEITEGELVTIVGANGAGKTTILNTILGVVKRYSGKIIFKGNDISNMKPFEIVSLGVGLIPEGRQLFPNMSVIENLELGFIGNKDKNKENFYRCLDYVFDLFPKLRERAKQNAGSLSGGEQQMVAIARGLMAEPKLLLLDEPSLGLAPVMVDLILDIIKKLHEEKRTILLVEQNVNHALKISDKTYVLENGTVAYSGKSDTLLHSDRLKTLYLGM